MNPDFICKYDTPLMQQPATLMYFSPNNDIKIYIKDGVVKIDGETGEVTTEGRVDMNEAAKTWGQAR